MKQQGIALIQVLLIVAVLSVLAMYFTHTARNQVQIAQWLDDKNTALVNLHNTESELLFLLLTELKGNQSKNNTIKWNFYNQPFTMHESVVVSMQDQAGLLSAHFPDVELLNKLVASSGIAPGVNFSSLLLDWQDLDNEPRPRGKETKQTRNGKIPHLQDLVHLKALSEQGYKILQNNMSIYRTGYYNPMASPVSLLRALTNNEKAQKGLDLRNNDELNKRAFKELTGLSENDSMFFYPSNNIAIKIKSTVGESVAEKEIIITLSPYAVLDVSPIVVMYNRG